METLQRTANRGSLSTGFSIDNSLKFEADNTEIIYRANESGTNRKTFTTSLWFKRTELGAAQEVWHGGRNGEMVGIGILTYSGFADQLWVDVGGGTGNTGTLYRSASNQVIRDTSAWYHFVLAVDTTQGTEANRMKVWLNGVEVTSWAQHQIPAQNYQSALEHGADMAWGGFRPNNVDLFSGYLAECHYLDGVAKVQTDFGEYDEDSGIWIPKAYTGTYGNNGCYMKYNDSSALGADSSGNGNTFTLNNISAADQATDSPTNSFCTLMPPQASITGTATVVSEGGTQMKGGSTSSQNAFGSIGVRKGKWYFESNVSNLGGVASYAFMFGVIAADRITALNNGGGYYIGEIANTWGFTSNNRGTTGGTENPNFPSETATSGTTEVMGIALDMDNGKIWVHKAGTYATNNSGVTGNPATGAAPQYDNLLTSTDEHILVGGGVSTSTNAQRNMNFGNPMNANFTGVGTHSDANGYGSFAYAPPSGYYAICTKNLAEYG